MRHSKSYQFKDIELEEMLNKDKRFTRPALERQLNDAGFEQFDDSWKLTNKDKQTAYMIGLLVDFDIIKP